MTCVMNDINHRISAAGGAVPFADKFVNFNIREG
jgi:hypothetical protein